MKKIFTLIFAILLGVTFSYAQDTLYIFKSDASMTKILVADIDSMTFEYVYESGGNGGGLLGNDGTLGTVTDGEGNTYKTVIIGEQEWMAENLKATKYNDGSDISTLGDYKDMSIEDWRLVTDGVYSIYQEAGTGGGVKDTLVGLTTNEEVLAAYGALYNWYAASSGKICPTGWKVPSVDDFQALEDYLKNDYGMVDVTGGEPGKTSVTSALRSCRQVAALESGCATTDHPRWDEGFFPGVDMFGFAGLPAGYMYGKWKQFEGGGKVARWWCQEEKADKTENGELWDMNVSEEYGFARRNYPKYYQYSIRCVKE